MGELLRLYQVNVSSEGEAPLRGCSLDLEDGEILFVAGDRRSGKHLLLALLGGQMRIEGGRLYFHEERLRDGRFGKTGILTVDHLTRMTGPLSAASNIRSLGGKISRAAGLRELFAELGIESSPQKPAGEYSPREQVLLWFALAALRGDLLICLDLSDMSFSEEDFRKLRPAVDACRKRRIAVMILDKAPNPLRESADRVAWMNGGKVIKNFYRKEDFPWMAEPGTDHLRCELIRTRPGAEREKASLDCADRPEERVVLREGDMLILYDPDWPAGLPLTEYMERLHFAAEPECIYIPEDSQDNLMEYAGIGRNLMLSASRFVGVRFGFIQRDMERFLESQFRQKFSVDKSVEQVSELTPQEKKYLTFYRASLNRPGLMLLENPLFVFPAEERQAAADTLREMASAGPAMIISVKTPEEAGAFTG